MASMDIFTYVGISLAIVVIVIMFGLCRSKGGCNNCSS